MNAIVRPLESQEITVDELVAQWIDAKRAEDAANRYRVNLEEQIIACVGEPDEGSQTHELVDGSKLVVTGKITRTVDEAAWRSVMQQIPEHLRPIAFVETPKIDLKGLRWLQTNEPALYAIVAQTVTARRAKTSISVKV